MGRRTKNKHQSHSVSTLNDRKFEVYQVKIPFFTKVTFKILISKDTKSGKKYYGTITEIINKSISEKKEIKKQFKEQNKVVTKIEEATFPITDHCPECHDVGKTIIARKDASDNRVYLEGKKKERPDEYWLTYTHKIDGKIIRHKVGKYIKNTFHIKNSLRKNIDLDKFMFPRFTDHEIPRGELSVFF